MKRQAKNARKRAIAIELRALRDTRGLSQTEVAEIGGMTLSMIARLEALTGRVPRLELIESYVQACGGHMALHISRDRFER
ncbi:MAG: helix-turn-helix transcriptional regulator [Roseibium sp.]|uniref:helix-turn-helix domain-containing protein n=1 Tax=Roseibium sp. TaxID=1936156 RepID=UPI003264701B